MAAAPQHPDLRELVDQLTPAQADAVRAVVVQLVTPAPAGAETLPRRLPFIATLSAEEDFAERSEEVLDEMIRRNTG